jgi:hypothetical protein
MAKARGIPPLGRTPNALPAPQAPAYLPMAKARGITQDLVSQQREGFMVDRPDGARWSCGLSCIVLEQSPKPLATQDRPFTVLFGVIWQWQPHPQHHIDPSPFCARGGVA